MGRTAPLKHEQQAADRRDEEQRADEIDVADLLLERDGGIVALGVAEEEEDG